MNNERPRPRQTAEALAKHLGYRSLQSLIAGRQRQERADRIEWIPTADGWIKGHA